ncbi:hypothetical protein BDR03DRAFT_1017521 [Suillus americanus]|nr:hypothetical protein BDR03DRAFT_1017521 [Suillus americanus]
MAVKAVTFDPQVELLERSVPIWPTQLRLELEAQLWKHVEYFPLEINISLKEVRVLQIKLNWYRVGKFSGIAVLNQIDLVTNRSVGIRKSTVASLSWTLDQMKEMASELAIAVELIGPNEIMDAPGVAICVVQIIAYNPYVVLFWGTRHGERHKNLENSPIMTGVAVAMLYIPIMVLKRLRDIYVDGLVSGVDIRAFTDDFSAQSKAQTTMASVIMAVDASILAIPGLGLQIATKTLCSVSFILNVSQAAAPHQQGHFPHLSRIGQTSSSVSSSRWAFCPFRTFM